MFPDYVVPPSHVQLKQNSVRGQAANAFSYDHPQLRFGYTIKRNTPETPTNGESDTYDVLVPITHPSGSTTMIVRACQTMNLLGSIADTSRTVYRTPDNYSGILDEQALQQCSKVLVLFLNGRTTDPVIIGALQHPSQTAGHKEDTNNLAIVVNGMSFTIDNEGQFRVQYASKTLSDGSPADEDISATSGSHVQFNKDGSITIATGTDKPQSVTLSPDGSISVISDKSVSITTKDTTVKSADSILLDSAKVTIGDGSQKMLRGSAYRQAESAMLGTLKQSLNTAATQLVAQGAILNALSTALGLGPTGGAPVTMAGSALTSAVVAITDFEAKSGQYLSEAHSLE